MYVRIEMSEEFLVPSDDVALKLHPFCVFLTIQEASLCSGLDLVFSALPVFPTLSPGFPLLPRSKLTQFRYASARTIEAVFQHSSGYSTMALNIDVEPDYPQRLPHARIVVQHSNPADQFEQMHSRRSRDWSDRRPFDPSH